MHYSYLSNANYGNSCGKEGVFKKSTGLTSKQRYAA